MRTAICDDCNKVIIKDESGKDALSEVAECDNCEKDLCLVCRCFLYFNSDDIAFYYCNDCYKDIKD